MCFPIYVDEQGEDMRKALLIDIDGTLANCNHRHKYLKGMETDWDLFHKFQEQDTVYKWCEEIIHRFENDHEIIFITGRPERYREVTEKWLIDNLINNFTLYMRPEGTYQLDSKIKIGIYNEFILDKYSVTFVLEDRSRCVEAWRRIGLICLQCSEGNF